MAESLTHASRDGCYLRLCGVKITCLFTFRQRAQEWVTRNCRIKSRQVLSSSSFFERNETLPEHGLCARRGTIAEDSRGARQVLPPRAYLRQAHRRETQRDRDIRCPLKLPTSSTLVDLQLCSRVRSSGSRVRKCGRGR